jgi:hypothetical protein
MTSAGDDDLEHEIGAGAAGTARVAIGIVTADCD